MNKKPLYHCSAQNLGFIILTIFASINFIFKINNALLTIQAGGVLHNVQCSIFAIKISVSMDTNNYVYNIINYPLIPLLVGGIYNILIMVKNRSNKDIINS